MTTSSTSPRRLLIIDDNEAIHGDFDKILSSPATNSDLQALDAEFFGTEPSPAESVISFEVQHAMQGREGLKLLEQDKDAGGIFGAAFVDMRMPPGWDGVETIERLWAVDPHLQVVICTAFSDHSWEDITARLGLCDQLLILKKPFDEIVVMQLATTLCERRRRQDELQMKIKQLERMVTLQSGCGRSETLIPACE